MIITSFEGFMVPEVHGKNKPHVRKIFTGHWLCRTEPPNMHEIWALGNSAEAAYKQWLERNRA